MDAASAVVTLPAAAASTATPPPTQQQALTSNTVNVNQSNSNNNNNLHTATTTINNSSSNSLNSIGVSSNSNSSCSSSSTSSNSSSSGYGSTTTTPTNNYDLQQQQTTPTTTPIPTTPVAIAEPIIPVATVAAVTPFYNEALTTQHNLETYHLHHQHSLQQQHYPHSHLLPTNHHQLPPTNLQTTTPQHPQQQQHHQYLSRQQYYSSYDYQQTPAPTHNVAAVAANVGYNMGIAGAPYELNPSTAANTTAYNTGHYKSSNIAGAINYERSPLVATAKATNFNQQQPTPNEQQQSKAIAQQNSQFPGVLAATKQRSSSSLIGNSSSTNTSKPQAAATPFYSQPITPTAHSNPTPFYDHLKHKMPLEYGHEAYNNPSAVGAASYHQQQQKYYAAKTQLKEAAYGTPSNINSKNVYGNSNSFFAGSGATHSTYDKYGAMYPQNPQTGFTASSQLGNETPPDIGNYRKPVVVNSVNSSSWPWGIDCASGNSRTIPPPNSHLPTATVAPTHATYLPPQPTALARDPYYMPDKYGPMKYDKYGGMSYQQPYVSPSARAHHMWPNTAHASNLTPLNDRHLLAPASAVPVAHGLQTTGYFPSNSNSSLNARQSCCSQPYQPQSCYYPSSHNQPPQRLPLNQTPPANAPPTAGYLSAQPPMGQSPHLNALTASCKYGSGIMADFSNGSKIKTTNDLYLNSHPYDNHSSPHNYGYGTTAHASSPQLYASNAHAQTMAQGLTPTAHLSHDPLNANPASYTNDLSLTTSNFDNYHSHLEPHLSTQNMTAIHGQQQPPPPAYGPTVAKRALLDYRKPIQPQPPPALTEECYSSFTSRDHYNQQELLNTPETTTTFGEYETAHTDTNTYTHSAENVTETDKSTEEGNKNISLRDFLANWNDDEDEYQNTEELNFEQAAVIEEVLQTAPEEAGAVQVAEPQDTEIIKEKTCAEIKPLEETKKLQENLSATDINQYVNLPDIVIDIEKSNNVNNSITTPTTSPTPPKVLKTSDDNANTLNLNNFDVEKELDELKLKKTSSQELTKDLHDIKETQSVATPQTSPNKHQPLSTQLSFEDLNLETPNKTVLNEITTQLSKPQNSELNEQYFKDLEGYESGNSHHSNESAFEKEYETFINKFSSESSTHKDKETSKSELEKEVDFEQNVQDFSKFYKRKRKLKEDEQKNPEPERQNQKKVKTSTLDTVNNSNFPQVYTKKSRNRLLVNKTQTPRKRKAFSAYYKAIHSIRRLGWHRLKRVKEYMTELKEKHLPLIKRQSIKNYTHGLTENAHNVKSLKSLCIMTINTEEFHKILTLNPVETQDNNTAKEEGEKHVCTDPTCETCEVIRSLMEAESIEETIMQQAGESSDENLEVPKAIIYEIDNNELVTIVENIEDIVDLKVQLEEPPKIISNENENLEHSEDLVDTKAILNETSDAKEILNGIGHVQHSQEILTEFKDKDIREHSMDSVNTSPILKEISDTEMISNTIEHVQNSKEFTNDLEAKNSIDRNFGNKSPELEANFTNSENEFMEPTSPVVSLSNKNSPASSNSNLIESKDCNRKQNEDEVSITKILKEDNTKLDVTEHTESQQEIATETKFPEPSREEVNPKSEKSPSNENEKSEGGDSEISGSDSESSSSSTSSSSSADDSVDDNKSSAKKSVSSNGSSYSNTESDFESESNECNSDSSNLETKQANKSKQKSKIKITIKEPKINNTNKMQLDTNSDSDSENEITHKSPKRIVMRFKKSSISSKSSPNQNSSIDQVSDESRKYTNSESEDEKHFEVISSTTLKLKRKRKILLKIPRSKVNFSNQTDSDSEYSDSKEKKSEFSSKTIKPGQKDSFKDRLSSMDSNTNDESDDNEISDNKSCTNEISGGNPKLMLENISSIQKYAVKEHSSSMDSNSDSDSENNEISAKKLSPSLSPTQNTCAKDSTHLDSDGEREAKCGDNLYNDIDMSLEEFPKTLIDVSLKDENTVENNEATKNTPSNISPHSNDIKENIRADDIVSEKFLESQIESDSESEDIVEKSHLKITQMKSPTIDLFPEPPTKSDHVSESDEEEQIIPEKKNDYVATLLSPKIQEHTELHSESESDEAEIFEENKFICNKSPSKHSESLNVNENICKNYTSNDYSHIEEDLMQNHFSECRKEAENLKEHSSDSNLTKNIPISNEPTEGSSNLENPYEVSCSNTEFNTINEKSKTEDLLNDTDKLSNENIEVIQNLNEVEMKNYTTLSDSESEIVDETGDDSLEKSSRNVQSEKDDNKTLLLDSESYSYFEYEADDDENEINQSPVSEPIEISDDESMDSSKTNKKTQIEITENNDSKERKSDEIQDNITNLQEEITKSNNFEKLADHMEEANLSKEMTEVMETPMLISNQDSELFEDKKLLNIGTLNSKDYSLNTETRIENSQLKTAKDNAISLNESEESNLSEESDSEIDDKPKTPHENQAAEQQNCSSENSDSDTESHEIQSKEKLSNISKSFECETKNTDEYFDYNDVENSKVMIDEFKNCSEKSRTSINSPTNLEEIADQNFEKSEENNENYIKSITDTISHPILNSMDVIEEVISEKEHLNNLTIKKRDVEEISTSSKETRLQEHENCLEQNKTTANKSDAEKIISNKSLENDIAEQVFKESLIKPKDLENKEKTCEYNVKISSDDIHTENLGTKIGSLANSDDFEDKETEEFPMAKNSLKSISALDADIESAEDNIKISEPSISEIKHVLHSKDDNNESVDENNHGCLEKNLEVLETMTGLQKTGIESPKDCHNGVNEQLSFEKEKESEEVLKTISSREDHVDTLKKCNSVLEPINDKSYPVTESISEKSNSSVDSVAEITEKKIADAEVDENCIYDSPLPHPTASEFKEKLEELEKRTDELEENTPITTNEPCNLENSHDPIDRVNVNTINIESDIPEISVSSDITINCEPKILKSTNEADQPSCNLLVEKSEEQVSFGEENITSSSIQSSEDVQENVTQNSAISNDNLGEIIDKSVSVPVLPSNEACESKEKSTLSLSLSDEMCETLKLTEEPETEVLEELEGNSIETENEIKLPTPTMETRSETIDLTDIYDTHNSSSLEDNLNENSYTEDIVENVKTSNESEKTEDIFGEEEHELPSSTASVCETSLDNKEPTEATLETETDVITVKLPGFSEDEKANDVAENQTKVASEKQLKDKELVSPSDISSANQIEADKEAESRLKQPSDATCLEPVNAKENQFETLFDDELVTEACSSSVNSTIASEESEAHQQSFESNKICSEEAEPQQLLTNLHKICSEDADIMENQIETSTANKLVNEIDRMSVNKIETFEKSETPQQSLSEPEKIIEESSNLKDDFNENSKSYEKESTENLTEPEIVVSKSITIDKTPLAVESNTTSTNIEKSQNDNEFISENHIDISDLNSNSIPNTLDKESVSQGDLSGDFYGFKNQSSFEDESGDFHGFEDLEEITRIRREIENLNEDSTANDGFLHYPTLNRDLHKASSTSLNSSTSSELNELEALEKEISQHQPEMVEEEEVDKETELLNECTKIVSTNDIEHIKQMLESDEEPQTEEDQLVADAVDDGDHDKDKFLVKSKNNLNDIISSNNSLIPKLSDLCRAALNSSLNSNTSNLAQQHNTNNTTNMTGDVMVERELSVEEALAEMYRQVGVLSDPEDNGDTDNATITGDTDEAHDVLLFNLQEILNSDNNDVYVLQCDMNEENVLNVVQTNQHEPQTENQSAREGDSANEVREDGVIEARENTNTQRVNTVQFIGILDTQSAEPQIHIISSDSESEVIILSDDESDIAYRPFIARHERITIPFINDHDMNDSDSLSDISTIHHEEIVPDNLNKFLQEEFYKYLHEKYVQRNISKYYHANRVLKKYKKRFIKVKRQ